jgi:rRNA maturation RNase YbeY
VSILFHNIDVDFNLPKKRIIKSWIKSVVLEYNFNLGDINYIFCSDEEILRVNIQYLNHNYYTDIITFPYTEEKTISADLYISIPTVKDNSNHYNQSFAHELNRVMVHGVLHLVGFNDSTDQEKREMRKAENHWLDVLTDLNSNAKKV